MSSDRKKDISYNIEGFEETKLTVSHSAYGIPSLLVLLNFHTVGSLALNWVLRLFNSVIQWLLDSFLTWIAY